MFPLLFNESVYYMTINDIEPETELLGTLFMSYFIISIIVSYL